MSVVLRIDAQSAADFIATKSEARTTSSRRVSSQFNNRRARERETPSVVISLIFDD